MDHTIRKEKEMMNLFTLADPKASSCRAVDDQPIVTLQKDGQCWADLHPRNAPSFEDTYRTDKSNSISRNETLLGKGVAADWIYQEMHSHSPI